MQLSSGRVAPIPGTDITMNKFLRYGVIFLGSVTALFAAVLVAVSVMVDPNDFKPMIVKMVQEKKQRTLTITGDIKLKLFPKLGIDLGKTSLSEHKGAREFASIDNLSFYVAWLPLLKKELVVDKISINGVGANLVRNPDGTTNFDDLLSKEESEQVKFDIDSVVLENGSVRFDDRLGGRTFSLDNAKLKTGRIADGVPTHFDLDADVKGSRPAMAVHVSGKSELVFKLKEKRYTLKRLDMTMKGDAADIKKMDLAVKGDIDVQATTKAIAVEDLKVTLKGVRGGHPLDIALDAPGLTLTDDKAQAKKLVVTANVDRPAGKLAAVLTLPDLSGNKQRFQASKLVLDLDIKQGDSKIKGQIATPLSGNLDTQTFALSNITGLVDIAHPKFPKGGAKLALNGNARLDLAKPLFAAQFGTKFDDSQIQAKVDAGPFSPLHTRFDIAIDQLDIDRYMPPKPKDAPPTTESPIDLSALKDLNASGSIRIGQLKVMNLKSSNVRMEIKSGKGRIDVDPLNSNLYQGSLKGALGATATANPTFTVRQHLTDISIGPLLRDLANKDLLEGKGNVTLDISTRGATIDAMKKALNGTAATRLQDGAIKGVDIAGAIRGAKAKLGALRGEQTQTADARQQTDFSELSASFNIQNGVARNDDLLAKSPLLRLNGSGDVDIGAGAMNYLAKATVVGSLEGQGGRELADLKGVTIPVRVTGPFDALKYHLDMNALAQEAVKSKAREKIQEQIEKRGGKDLLKGLFGR